MRMGAGKEKIILPESLFPIESFGGIHDDLYVKALIIEAETKFILISFDATSLRPYAIEKFKALAAKTVSVPTDQIWICVSHTFSTPHLRSEEALAREGEETVRKNNILLEAMSQAMEKALSKAEESSEEVLIGFGKAYCSININRDAETEKGWWLGANEKGISDKNIPFVKFESIEGKPKALIYSCDVQSSVMDHSKYKDGFSRVTADLAGAADRYIDKYYGESFTSFFLLGAAGDQAPLFKARYTAARKDGTDETVDLGENGFILAEALGRKLGEQIISKAEKTPVIKEEIKAQIKGISVKCPGQKIIADMRQIKPVKEYNFMSDKERDVRVELFTLSSVAIIGTAPELSSKTAMGIKEQSPYPLTFVITMVNGADKYMPDQSAYDRITYEAMNSMFARGSAESLAEKAIEELKKMKGGN